MERVSKKCRGGAKQDFLWRYLGENALGIQRGKVFADTWFNHYWKNHNARDFMTPEKWNFMMCPIRHFKDIITMVDTD